MILVRVYLLPLTDLFYRFAAEFVYGVLKEIGRSVAKEHKCPRQCRVDGFGRRVLIKQMEDRR